MMRYVCTDCDWTTDAKDSLADDLGSLAVDHHITSGHAVELADSRRPRSERTAADSAGT